MQKRKRTIGQQSIVEFTLTKKDFDKSDQTEPLTGCLVATAVKRIFTNKLRYVGFNFVAFDTEPRIGFTLDDSTSNLIKDWTRREKALRNKLPAKVTMERSA